MKRILVTTLAILILTASCQADTFHLYKDEIKELLQDPRTRKFKGGDEDLNDLSGCPYLIELGTWLEYESQWGNGWDRWNVWRSGTVNNHKVFGIREKREDLSNKILQNKSIHPVYIGPWRNITLTHTEGSFFNRKTIEEKKQIRFFAYYPKEGGNIQYQYESMNEENKSIPEKKFSLSPTAKIAPDRFSLCVVKWTARFGYNAVAEVKSKNPFSKNYLVPTGKIIEAKE
jgi:hypothetical protein